MSVAWLQNQIITQIIIGDIENKINNTVTTTGLLKKTDFDNELKKVNDKICTNSSDILLYESRLKQKEDVTNSLERHASYNRGTIFFGHDGQQNFLVFQLTYEYLKRVIVTTNNISTIYVHYWQSEGLSNEQIKPPNISTNNDLAPVLEYDRREMNLKFSGGLLRQSRVTYNHGPKINIFIVYKLNTHTMNTDFALRDCLFGSVKITKGKDPDNYVYSGFGIGFDSKSTWYRCS